MADSDLESQLLRFLERLSSEAEEHFYQWVRQMLTLSAGALTLLVALQGSFVPERPRCLWLLALSWIGLSMSIIAATVALKARHRVYDRMAEATHKTLRQLPTAAGTPQTTSGVFDHMQVERPERFERTAGTALPWLLALALLSLTLFALLNLSATPATAAPPAPHDSQHAGQE